MTELGDRASPSVYRLQAVLRGVGPLVWRRLLVRSDSTVGDLHAVLQTGCPVSRALAGVPEITLEASLVA